MPLTRREYEQLLIAIDCMGSIRYGNVPYVSQQNVKCMLEQWLVEDDRPSLAEIFEEEEDDD